MNKAKAIAKRVTDRLTDEVKLTPMPDDRELIVKICDRYVAYMKKEHNLKVRRPDIDMDVAATHLNGCPLDLKALLEFDDFNFVHDMTGMVRYLNRDSGQLEQLFLPRCAR